MTKLQDNEHLQTKTCPQCGHDIFHVCKTWRGEERYIQRAPNSYGKEIINFDEEEYHLIQCASCSHEIRDIDKLYLGYAERIKP